MSASPDQQHSSNINVKESEQKLDHELNNITPVIGTVIKSLYDSFNGIETSKNADSALPAASQLLAVLPQLHSVLRNINEIETENSQHHSPQTAVALGAKLLKDTQIQNILDNEKILKAIDQSLVQFDTFIDTPLVQQLLNTIDADSNQIKKAVHMHNASVHQRLTAFEPIVNAVRSRSQNHMINIQHMIDEIISHPDRLITILFENAPEIVTNFLSEKGFGKEQVEYLITQIPLKSTIRKEELIDKLEKNDTNGIMNKIENELKQSSIEKFTLNDCLKQLTSTPNLRAFETIIHLLGQSAINQRKNK